MFLDPLTKPDEMCRDDDDATFPKTMFFASRFCWLSFVCGPPLITTTTRFINEIIFANTTMQQALCALDPFRKYVLSDACERLLLEHKIDANTSTTTNGGKKPTEAKPPPGQKIQRRRIKSGGTTATKSTNTTNDIDDQHQSRDETKRRSSVAKFGSRAAEGSRRDSNVSERENDHEFSRERRKTRE